MSPSQEYDFLWRYYNRDGSTVEMCGNGARCVSKFMDKILQKKQYTFCNNFGIVTHSSHTNDLVRVSMPFSTVRIEESIDNAFFIQVGVPHLVIILEEIDDLPVDTLGPEMTKKINQDVNVNFTDGTKVRTYERGCMLNSSMVQVAVLYYSLISKIS